MTLRLFGPILLLGFAVPAGPQTTTPPPTPPTPCLTDPKYREFDFWLGTWDVHPNGKPERRAGSNVITKAHKDCVILENWTGARGVTGSSFNIYDASRSRWYQTWVDSTGELHEYSGAIENGNMVYFGDLAPPPGQTDRVRTRLTFFNQGPDRVRQLSERTPDGGKTWVVNFDLIYVRRKPAPSGAAGRSDRDRVNTAIRTTVKQPAARDGKTTNSGAQVLASMLEALGGRAGIEGVTSLFARAECTGPEGSFTTSVWSQPPRRMRFEQRFADREVAFLLDGDRGWRRNPASGRLEAIPPTQAGIIRGHDFHFMLLHADRWFSDPVLVEEGERSPCRRLALVDRLGRRAELCLDRETSLPSSLTIQLPADADPIMVEFEDWQEIASVRYLKSFRLHHRKEAYHYRYTQILPGGAEDAAFEAIPKASY